MKVQYFTDRYIPDEGPQGASILLVGEAPGEQEYELKRPFVGTSGDKLVNVLERNGTSRSDVRLANLFHHRPYHNKFELIDNTDILQDHIRQLYSYIETYKPVVIGALGAYPLKYLTGKEGIGHWRGSILPYINDPNIKVIPTYHPAAVTREASLYPTFDLDIKRIVSDSKFREFRLRERQLVANPTGIELQQYVELLCNADVLAVDIENIKKSTRILCVGFAPSPSLGVSISAETDEGERAIRQILSTPNKKIYHNGTHDTTILKLNNYELVRDDASVSKGWPYYWDTMLAQHVLAPELPKSLEYITSINTREPYYKSEGRSNIPDDTKSWSAKRTKEGLYIYNCKDVCVTIENYLSQSDEITNTNLFHTFDFEMQSLVVAHHISFSGMLRDNERAKFLTRGLLQKYAIKQFALDNLTGYPTNVRSTSELPKILYDKDKMGLPVRRNRNQGVTTDEDAIVSLIAFCKDKIQGLKRESSIAEWNVKLVVLKTILEIRGIRQLLSNYLLAEPSLDGRVRSTYKVAGTETGRWSAAAFVDGTGYNSQTNPRDPVEIAVSYNSDIIQIDEEILDKMMAALYKEREQQETEEYV